jgi:hypothetical protein
MTARTLAEAMTAGLTPADLARLREQLARLRSWR